MYWDATHVRPLADHKIYVELANGRKGVFDVQPYLDLPAFRALREVSYFNEVGIQMGAVTWPGGQDIAPDTLLAVISGTEQALLNP